MIVTAAPAPAQVRSARRPSAQRLATIAQPRTAPDGSPISGVDADAERLAYAQDLAARGAVFAAAEEFQEVLTSVAARNDGARGSRESMQALAAALIALDEADDFYRIRSSLNAARDVSNLIGAHETDVLKNAAASEVTPLRALQAYHAFAGAQLKVAGGADPAAAAALYGLARLEPVLSSNSRDGQESAVGARVTTLLQAALSIDPSQHEAANELGVVMARYGRHEQAAELFKQALRGRQTPETWHNFATVLERMGHAEEAARARSYCEQAQKSSGKVIPAGANAALPAIRWVEPAEFAAAAPDGPPQKLTPSKATPPSSDTPREARAAKSSEPGGLLRLIRQRFTGRSRQPGRAPEGGD